MDTNYSIKNKNENTTQNQWLLPFMVVFFAVFCAAFSVGSYSYGRILTIFLIFFSIFLKVEDLFCLIIFCFPFSSMLKLSVTTISMIPVLYLIVLLKSFTKGKIAISPIALLCYFLFVILQVTNILAYGAAYSGVISTMLNVAFVMFISNYFQNSHEANPHFLTRTSLFFASGTTVMLLMCDLFTRLPYMVNAKQATIAVETDRYSATVLDPNELSQIILIAIGLLIAISPFIQSKWGKFVLIAMMAYIAITGVRTNSKSYVITMVGLFAFLMYIYIRSVARKEGSVKALLRFLPILAITLVGCVLLFIYVVLPVFESRSSENTDLLTNRTTIWTNYISALSQRPDVSLIGVGGGNVTRIMHLVGRDGRGVPHNAYLEYFIQFGLIGLIMLIVCWKSIFAAIKEKVNTYFVVPLLAFMVTAFAISVNSNDCPFILLSILALPLPPETEKLVDKNKQKSVANQATA